MAEIELKINYKIRKNQKRKTKKKENKIKKNAELSLKDVIQSEHTKYPSELENLEDFILKDGFERFKMPSENDKNNSDSSKNLNIDENLPRKAIAAAILESDHTKDELEDGEKLSKKKWKKLNRMSIGDLKIRVKNPGLVEPWDNCSRDPLFLLELKSKRHSVPVPRHWCVPGKYLQNKRGFVKPPFKLPDFIANTGIMEVRQTADSKEASKTLKTKMKEKIRPKVGLIDISYEKLYNAFFVHQTKPPLTKFGDIYYQGKELEARRKENRPGVLSDELRLALGMPAGSEGSKYPPPWLISQQRYGPPPSYPNLKIPGLNAGLPPGCSYGFHVGGWGKPPVDEDGKPLYGDVFANAFNTVPVLIDIDAEEDDDKYWGEIESDGENSEEEKSESSGMEEEEEEKDDSDHLETTVQSKTNGTSSLRPTAETPTEIELRKTFKAKTKEIKTDTEEPQQEKQLFKIIPEVKNVIGQDIMGSERVYALSNSETKIELKKRKNETTDSQEEKPKKRKEFKF